MPELHVAELARVCAEDGTVVRHHTEPTGRLRESVPRLSLRARAAAVPPCALLRRRVIGLEGDDALKADFAARREQGEKLLKLDALGLRSDCLARCTCGPTSGHCRSCTACSARELRHRFRPRRVTPLRHRGHHAHDTRALRRRTTTPAGACTPVSDRDRRATAPEEPLTRLAPCCGWSARSCTRDEPDARAATRAAVESYVDATLRSMPEHLRLGVAAESLVFGALLLAPRTARAPRRSRVGTRLADGRRARSTRPPVRPPAPIARAVRRERADIGRIGPVSPMAARRRSTPRSSSSARARAARSPPRRSRGAGCSVTVLEEGPWVDPDALEPFSLEEMVAKYRHGGSCAALGRPGDRVRRGPLRRRQHRDQQRPLPPAPPSSPTSGGATSTSTSSAPPRSTATRSASRTSSACRACRARRRPRRQCSSGARPSSAGRASSSRGSSATSRTVGP